MRAYIAECQTRNARYKTAYADSPDFVFMDKSSLEQRVLDELEGGLHEVIGGPLGSAVTPFS
jgi:translation elongation factor P/translation initiation factor 5A